MNRSRFTIEQIESTPEGRGGTMMESIISAWIKSCAGNLPWQYHERRYTWRGERVRVLYHWQYGEIARACTS